MPDPKPPMQTGNQVSSESTHQWLAHELHDGLLPWVVSARMQLEAAVAKLDQDNPVAMNLRQAMRSLKHALSEGRSLMNFLVDELAECDDLTSLVQQYVQSVAMDATLRNQSIEFFGPKTPFPDLPNQKTWAIYRWVQQAITNAIQHAGPTEIRVKLQFSVDPTACLEIEVADQGVGFEPTRADLQGHYGMQSLQLRARQSGGRCSIDSQPGHGCRCQLHVPIQ